MCEFTCISCKNYIPEATKVVGWKEECGGMILSPISKEIPAHCDKHPRYFKKWWKENGKKKREDAVQPKCIELHDSIKSLVEMNKLAQEILDNIKK